MANISLDLASLTSVFVRRNGFELVVYFHAQVDCGQAGVKRCLYICYPGKCGICARGEISGGAGQEVQRVGHRAWRACKRMITGGHKNYIVLPRQHEGIRRPVRAIDTLIGIAGRTIEFEEAEAIQLRFQHLSFVVRLMSIVLSRRIARPVAAWRI